jgi:hypothetical protein
MKAEKKEARKLAAEMGEVGEMGENVPAEDADEGAPALPD